MTDSELENLQCYPFHLPPVELKQRIRGAYRPLNGRDCVRLGGPGGLCSGPVREVYMEDGMTINYYCQGHAKGKAWKYEEEV